LDPRNRCADGVIGPRAWPQSGHESSPRSPSRRYRGSTAG